MTSLVLAFMDVIMNGINWTIYILEAFRDRPIMDYVGVSESKVPYFFATKILHIIRCLFYNYYLLHSRFFHVVTFSVDASV